MWEGYLHAITEYIAAHEDVTAQLVVDRFHVAQHYRDDFDDLRKQEMKRLKKELPEQTYDQDCKGTLWLLRQNHVNLDQEERKCLRRLLKHSPELHAAYTLREELTAIFNRGIHQKQVNVGCSRGWIRCKKRRSPVSLAS